MVLKKRAGRREKVPNEVGKENIITPKELWSEWRLTVLSLAISLFLGLWLYDFFSAIVLSILAILGGITLFAFVLSVLGFGKFRIHLFKTHSAMVKASACVAGVLCAAVLSFVIAGVGGVRLNISATQEVSPSPEGEPSQTQQEIDPMPQASAQPPPAPTPSNVEDRSQATDIPEPGVISPAPKEPEGEMDTCTVREDFFTLLNADFDTAPDFSPEAKKYWKAFFLDELKSTVNTVVQTDIQLIDNYSSFVSKTEKANEKEAEMRAAGRNIESQEEIILLRQLANDICETRDLNGLLANDYHNLGELYSAEKDWGEAYKCFTTSIAYRIRHITFLPQSDDSFYCDLYEIADAYQWIGKIWSLSTAQKIEAHYISACLLEETSQHIFAEHVPGRYQFGSYFYAGMANHKLLNLHPVEKNREALPYLLDAYAYYKKAVDGVEAGTLTGMEYLKDGYEYLSQICQLSQRYIKKWGQADGLFSASEYESLIAEYDQLSL